MEIYSRVHDDFAASEVTAWLWNIKCIILLLLLLRRGSGCEVLWSVCVCVCMYVREDISGTTRAIFTKIFMHVAYGRHGLSAEVQK